MEIRCATVEDAGRISELMGQLGYLVTPELVARRLVLFAKRDTDVVLVAQEYGQVVGAVSLHVMDLFHVEGRLGRITLLVVDAVARGKGVGTNLVIHADAYFRKHECARAEVTSGDQRHEAHAF